MLAFIIFLTILVRSPAATIAAPKARTPTIVIAPPGPYWIGAIGVSGSGFTVGGTVELIVLDGDAPDTSTGKASPIFVTSDGTFTHVFWRRDLTGIDTTGKTVIAGCGKHDLVQAHDVATNT